MLSKENNMEKKLLLLLFLTYPLQVFSTNLSHSNKLFHWAEANYSQYFNPPGGKTFKIENYWVRYYENTNIYMGTLGENVYVYGEIFNGLKHIGVLGDFIDLTSSTYNKIKITGSDEFIIKTQASLELLKNQAPSALKKIEQYIGIIEQGEFSHMWAFEEPSRYEVCDLDSFYSVQWFAGAIAHEATHSELYHAYQAKQGLPVPAHIWSSETAEKLCIQYQIDVLQTINAPQYDIDSLNELLADPNCNIDDTCN